jgi:hypothetical protein
MLPTTGQVGRRRATFFSSSSLSPSGSAITLKRRLSSSLEGARAMGSSRADHTQFRLPRQPQILALSESGKEAVVEALSRYSADFSQAREFVVEYQEYLRSQAEAEKHEGQD